MSPDRDLAELFARERRAHPTSASSKAGAWSRLEKELDLGPSDPGGGGGGTSVPAASVSRLPSAKPRWLGRLPLAACVIVAAGAMWGVASKTTDAPSVAVRPEPAVLHLPEVVSAKPAVPEVASVSIDALPRAPEPKAVATTRPRTSIASADPVCTICDERAILDVARRGLREKRHDDALAAVAEHRARFPSGQLAEERESLRVHVLAAMGRLDEADAVKREFHRAYPESPLLDSVQRAGSR